MSESNKPFCCVFGALGAREVERRVSAAIEIVELHPDLVPQISNGIVRIVESRLMHDRNRVFVLHEGISVEFLDEISEHLD